MPQQLRVASFLHQQGAERGQPTRRRQRLGRPRQERAQRLSRVGGEHRVRAGVESEDGGDDDVRLRVEAAVDGRSSDACGIGDGRDRHRLVADIAQETQGGVEDRVVDTCVPRPASGNAGSLGAGRRMGHSAARARGSGVGRGGRHGSCSCASQPAPGRAHAPASGPPSAARRTRRARRPRRRRRRPDARRSRRRPPACRLCGLAPGEVGPRAAARARRRPGRTAGRAHRPTRGSCSRLRCARRRAPGAGRRSACRRTCGCRRSDPRAGAY